MPKVLRISVFFILLFLSVIIMIIGCGSDSNTVIYNPTSTPAVTPQESTPTVTPAPSQTGIITGQVKDETGNPVANAYVIYYVLTTGQTYTVTADENGMYRFENIPPGPGRIEMWKSKSDHDNSPGNPSGAVNVITGVGTNTVNITAGQVDPTPAPAGTATATATPVQTQSVGNAIIDGIVQDSKYGGAPVSGATVRIAETGQYTITNSEGYFYFNVFPGVYTVIVNKAKHAQAKVQSVQAIEFQRTNLNILEYHAISNSWSNTSPTISGSIDLISGTVNATATGTYDISKMSLYTGNPGGFAFDTAYGNSLSSTIDPNSLPPGQINIYITAEDVNNNWTAIMSPYTLPDKSNQSLSVPLDVSASATTVGQGNTDSSRNSMKNLKYGRTLPQAFNGKTINTSAIPDGSSCFVDVTWSGLSDVTGYKIYRSGAETGSYTPVGFVFHSDYITYKDTDSSAVKPGATLYYKVSACDASGEGPLSDASPGVKVLDVLTVKLQSPANNSTVNTTNPTFRWTYNKTGDERVVTFYLFDGLANYQFYHQVTFSGDTDTYVYDGPPLLKNHPYEWNIFVDVWTNDGLSNSITGTGDTYVPSTSSTANNGRFQFTTDIH